MTEVLILYSYDEGRPTVPLAVYSDPQAAFSALGGVWSPVPGGWGGSGGWTSHDRDGVVLELVRYEVNATRRIQ